MSWDDIRTNIDDAIDTIVEQRFQACLKQRDGPSTDAIDRSIRDDIRKQVKAEVVLYGKG